MNNNDSVFYLLENNIKFIKLILTFSDVNINFLSLTRKCHPHIKQAPSGTWGAIPTGTHSATPRSLP